MERYIDAERLRAKQSALNELAREHNVRKEERLLSSISANLDEAAEDSWAVYEYRESPRGLYVTCYVDGFKTRAEWMAGQFQKIEGDLVDWYSTGDGKDYCCGVKTDEAFDVPEGFYIRKKNNQAKA